MKRPRIALWIKWSCRVQGRRVVRVRGNMRRLQCPWWLWRWAVRRVDRWHAWCCREDIEANLPVEDTDGWPDVGLLFEKLPHDAPVCPNCEGRGMIQVPETWKPFMKVQGYNPEFVTLNVLKPCPECSVR